jgi:hypothetical protein
MRNPGRKKVNQDLYASGDSDTPDPSGQGRVGSIGTSLDRC